MCMPIPRYIYRYIALYICIYEGRQKSKTTFISSHLATWVEKGGVSGAAAVAERSDWLRQLSEAAVVAVDGSGSGSRRR